MHSVASIGTRDRRGQRGGRSAADPLSLFILILVTRACGAYRRDVRHDMVLVPLAAAALLVAACTSNSQSSARPQSPSARASAAQPGTAQAGAATSNGCAGQPPVGPLPVWARAGFSPPAQPMPQVMGEAGNIVAILWADPALHSPPLPDRSNKILWVSRVPPAAPDPLVITATLAGGTRTVTRVGAGRPRTVDHRPAGARLLDTPPELVRPHRRTQVALRGLIGAVSRSKTG